LTSVSVIAAPVPPPDALLIPVTTALDHPNVAVVLELVAVYVFEVLLHQVAVAPLVITAVGLTVTVRSNGAPGHVPTVGVIM
jgi:hypothetical protein